VPTVKRIVCLANSRKLSGRCIAGRELVGGTLGGWVRPVSAREHEEVSEREREYQNGQDPQVLDVIDVPLVVPRANAFQTENWLLDPDYYWSLVDQMSPDGLADYVEDNGPLWLNISSTMVGLNDRVPLEQANKLRSSLRLIHVPSLELAVFAPGAAFGDRKSVV
jgi:hypothetical protein